jgi:hypothetical protein
MKYYIPLFVRATELNGEILKVDEVLTMSAQMCAANQAVKK